MAQPRTALDFTWIAARILIPLIVLIVCAVLLSPHINNDSLSGFSAQLANIELTAWCAALALSGISLWSVGRYDGVAHRHFATRIPQHHAQVSGTVAIALAQTFGFGVFTGTLARWRMLSGVTLTTAFKLSVFVSTSFMVCLSIIIAIACVIFPTPNWTFWPALIILVLVPIMIVAVFRWPSLTIKEHHIRMPNLQNSAAILFWTMIDTIAVAGAMYVLLPSGADIQFGVFLPLFLIALGTALISNIPGGVGPFELMMLGLLPQLPAVEVLGSIVAFRIVYYALPAFLAAILLLRPLEHTISIPPKVKPQLDNQPELQVIAQNGGRLLETSGGQCAIWPTTQTITALCNPIAGSMSAALRALKAEAAFHGKLPFVYKCNRQSAGALRRHGWSIMHMSDDAIINLQNFSLDRPALRTLRRKLRNASRSGVTIKHDDVQPWADLKRVDKEWQDIHGHARGGTIGRFEVGYLSNHFIARAEVNGKICAFASFQISKKEWCLDLMRHSKEAPDGTMHALIHAAIMDAKAAGIAHINLAATPACPNPDSPFFRWAARQAVKKAGGTGLRQFKSCFAPNWKPRYAAAPNAMALVVGLADITREVHNPDPISRPFPQVLSSINQHEIHNGDEYYELPSRLAS